MDTADIVTFAEHWGNYGLRQYVIPFIPVHDITSSAAARECRERIAGSVGLKCTAWNLVKQHLNEAYMGTSSPRNSSSNSSPLGRPVDEEAMYPYLKIAQERLSNDYAAVGLLEDFDTSLRLFDAALGMPRFDWTARYQRQGTVNEAREKQEDEKSRVLRQAWTNASVKRFLALDILLYDHAVSVHASQVAEYGL